MTNLTVYITDDRGRLLLPDAHEPLPDSVVMTEGLHGTAWQRFNSDGRWHPTRGGGSKSWADLLKKRNLVLIYDAFPRVPARGTVQWTGAISGRMPR